MVLKSVIFRPESPYIISYYYIRYIHIYIGIYYAKLGFFQPAKVKLFYYYVRIKANFWNCKCLELIVIAIEVWLE